MGPVINIGLGLIMTFAVMALIVTAANEAFARLLKTRAKTLEQGIKDLLNDPTLTGLAGGVLAHGAANPMLTPGQLKPTKPTNIEPGQFASALISVVQGSNPLTPLNEAVDKVTDPQIKAVLQGALSKVNGDVEKFHQEVANWFDTSMTSLSEAYKQNAQFWAFVTAMILTLLLNVDTFAIAKTLWVAPSIGGQLPILGQGSSDALNDLAMLAGMGLPLGWTEAPWVMWAKPSVSCPTWWVVTKLVGCGFTAAASMLGAPFWFDLLAKARGAAPVKP